MKLNVRALLAWVWLALSATMLPAQTDQGSLDLTLKVKDHQGRPLARTRVDFVEVHTRTSLSRTTDEKGEVQHLFQEGRYWQINIKDIRNYFFWQFEVKPKRKSTQTRTLTYNHAHYQRITRPPVDRSQLNLEMVQAQGYAGIQADEKEGVITLTITRRDGQALTNYPVDLTCYALSRTFKGKTNAAGKAFFKVPLGQEYEIDIDGIQSFAYIDLPNRPRYRGQKRFRYEPTTIAEKVRNDTITQTLAQGQKGTSGRVLSTITLKGGPNGVWRNEPVYVQELKGPQCYTARTDVQGKVRFLLPKGKQYMIHARFEKNLDVLDYRRNQGIGYSNKTVLYRPLEKYQFPERYIPKPEDLITKAFQEFLEQQYPRPEEGKALRTLAQFTGALHPEAKEAVLRLAFTTPLEASIDHAPKLNLAFVIDKSGSMAGEERIEQLKKSLAAFVKKLRLVDQVSLVTFEDFEEVVLGSQPLNRDRTLEAIQRLEAGGGTNIYKGLMAGYKEVAKAYRKGQTNRVILLSDGYGVTPPKEILEAQRPYTDKGIECSTVGVGEDYNFALLKMLATQGGGHVEHVSQSENMAEAFLRQLGAVMFPVAKNVSMEVIFPEGLKYEQLYGHDLEEKGRNRLKVKLPHFYAGMDELAFVHFKIPQASEELCAQLITIRTSYTDVATGQKITEEQEVYLEWKPFTGEPKLVRKVEEQKLFAVAVMNQSLKLMADHFHRSDLVAARDALQGGMDQLKAVYPQVKEEELIALRHQLENYLDIISKQLDSL